jgi:hypothetical protein
MIPALSTPTECTLKRAANPFASQHFLNFFPDPQEQGSFRPGFFNIE